VWTSKCFCTNVKESERAKLTAMEEIAQQKTAFAACKAELEENMSKLQSELSLQKTRLRELGKLIMCYCHHWR